MVTSQTYAPLSNKLVLASHNAGKLREIRALLVPYGFNVTDAGSQNVSEPEETGATFIENAELKARHSATATGLCALSDDSGLAVEALDGDPGIYSARWGGETKDFSVAMEKVENALTAKNITPEGAKAHFVCALSLAWPDGTCLSVEGKVHGALTFPPRGENGFGYDPIFIANGYNITFGEMNPDKKHSISHRADAFKQLLAACEAHQLLTVV